MRQVNKQNCPFQGETRSYISCSPAPKAKSCTS